MRERTGSGIPGLDDVLHGGYLRNRAYLVRGPPGVGKTLLGLHFLTHGKRNGERSMFINLGASEEDIRADAEAFGLDTSTLEFLDLSPTSELFAGYEPYDIFAASDVEGPSFAETIMNAITEADPDRVFIDPLTQFRYLMPDLHQYREQVLSFLQFLKEEGVTIVFTSQHTSEAPDDDLQFLSDGIIELGYNAKGRVVEVTKFRGSATDGGSHTVSIDDDGMQVFPILVPREPAEVLTHDVISSGNEGIDTLLNGGVERGTVSVISGPSGVGKTTTGTLFMREAASRGERSVIFLFEEATSTFIRRSESIGLPVREMMDEEMLAVYPIRTRQYSPDEFAGLVREEVEDKGTKVVMIDGIDGYNISLRGTETELLEELHSLGHYLRANDVTTILTAEVHDITGDFRVTDEQVSFLADNVLFLRYLEIDGEMRKAIGVLKKRASDFERKLRQLEITDQGIVVGDPLVGLQGILEGTPVWVPEPEDRGA